MKKLFLFGFLSLAILGTTFIMPTTFSTVAYASYNNPATGFWGHIDGTRVAFRESKSVNSNRIKYFSNNESVGIESLNAGTADGYQWSKVTDSNGNTGYVASKYLYTEGD
ncbi:SH3 domain-containing protein [Clostridium botulinum]|uniref:SH3 domain-containing protein n=1 Tax=Clostridium botulinum TaxID=1491 RepID=A0A846K3R0_CLOBO|nr:SH3 domain-containing protein [Clostridium botulinum]KAI3350850.1 SH3 domain-containing protein [Clostridium botulinum]KOM88835.1 hypothetical protein ACP51_06305 [Clostridium botulinum]KOR57672.1 hypothetical protein ADT22_12995 [Clostridium botulinum]MBY6916073.1 SH3 domain-containing protein [Clostridium botulinum]NFE12380.1 SH3 domain-containing protein [Clostridium botulinum]